MRLPEYILNQVVNQGRNPLVYCGHCDSVDNIRLDEIRDEHQPLQVYTASCPRCGEIIDTDVDREELVKRLRFGVSG